ncbi:sarcoplasmic calcium-binding protein-like [Mytilus edulis]|uniref:sarcoplasmic calcium-binding protein-like n=1 Tax=Mytilus edulis TaxID=6550 RepID=UPI0039F0180A
MQLSKIENTAVCSKSITITSMSSGNIEFLREKWSYWFDSLDVNHDGKITKADVDFTLKQFPVVEGLSEKEGKLADDQIEKWWNTYILRGKHEISKEEFLDDFEKEYAENKTNFLETIKSLFEHISNVIDTDKTKMISLDNYVNSFKTLGHDNEKVLQKAFELYKPSHGTIPIQEYIDDWVVFIANDDQSKPDCVYDVYKNGLL